jgi:hypothetical protein
MPVMHDTYPSYTGTLGDPAALHGYLEENGCRPKLRGVGPHKLYLDGKLEDIGPDHVALLAKSVQKRAGRLVRILF